MTAERGYGFWLLQGPGWLLLVYLVYEQAIPASDYEVGVQMGTQESADRITEVGTAFWYGFALADLAMYIPLLAAGLIALWKSIFWGRVVLGVALGITVYWPVVALAALVKARDAEGWALGNETVLEYRESSCCLAVLGALRCCHNRNGTDIDRRRRPHLGNTGS